MPARIREHRDVSSKERSEQRHTVSPSEEAHRQMQRDHPLEESQKSYHTMLEQQIARAEEELDRPALALFLSGLTAGLDIGFGPFAMVVSSTLLEGVLSPPVLDFLNANLYSIGFIFVIMSFSALFTEQPASAIQPVLSGRASVRSLLRLWAIVLVANVVGCVLFSWFAALLGPAMGIVEPRVMGELAAKMASHSNAVLLMSGVAAGWLLGLLSWMINASRDTISQLVFIWLTTMLIGLAGLHHSVATGIEILMGVFVGEGADWGDYGRFLVLAVIGNIFGGAFFVGVLKYAHIQRSASHE